MSKREDQNIETNLEVPSLNAGTSVPKGVDPGNLLERLAATRLPQNLQIRVLGVFDELCPAAQEFFGPRILKVCSLIDNSNQDNPVFPSRIQAARSLESLRMSQYLGGKTPTLVDPLTSALNWHDKNLSNDLGLQIVTRELILEMQTAKLISGLGLNNDQFSDIEVTEDDRKLLAGYDYFVLSKIAFNPPQSITGEHIRATLRTLPHPNYAIGAEIAKSKNDLNVLEYFLGLMPKEMRNEFLQQYEVAITNDRSAPDYSIVLKRRESLQASETVPLRLLFDYHPLSSLASVLTINRVDNYGNLVQAPFPQKEGAEKLGAWVGDYIFSRKGSRNLISVHRTIASLYGAAFCYQAEAMAYQRLIDSGEIDRALIAVRGRIHPLIVQWFNGARVGERSEVPDVNLIYMLPLGQGRHYPIVLHQSPDPLKQMKLNLPDNLTSKERELLNGVSDALDKGTLLRVLSNLDPKDFDPEGFDVNDIGWRPRTTSSDESLGTVPNQLSFLHCPELLSDPTSYNRYDTGFFAGLSRQLTSLGESVQKEIEHAPGNAVIEPTREIIHEAFIKWRHDNPDEEVIEDHVSEIETEALKRAKAIYDFEKSRLDSEEEQEIHRRRVGMGWPEEAPQGGIPLRLGDLIGDCVITVRHEGKKRNYCPEPGNELRPPTSFEEVEGMLRDTPHIVTLRYFDPLKRGGAANVVNLSGTRTHALDQSFGQMITKLDDDIIRVTKLLTNSYLALVRLKEQTTFGFSDAGSINLDDPAFKLVLARILSERHNGGSDGSPRIIEEAQAFLEEKIRKLGLDKALDELGELRTEIAAIDKENRKSCEVLRKLANLERKSKNSDQGLTSSQIKLIEALTARKESFSTFTDWLGFDPRRRFLDIRESRTVKLIYVIQSDESIVLEYEHNRKRKDVNHPMCANGLNVFGAGELDCAQYDAKFNSILDFLHGINERIDPNDPFLAKEENNGSGHYKPPWWTNQYTCSVVSWYLQDFKKHREFSGQSAILVLPEEGMAMSDYFSKGAHVPMS